MPWDNEGTYRSADGRLERSWRLTKAAWGLIRRDRALVALTVLGGLLSVAAVVAVFGLAGGLEPGRERLLLASAILAFPLTFAATFLNVAAAAAASAAFDGGRLTLRQALAVPVARIGEVLLWSVLATGVGVLLDQLAERLPFGGRVATWLAGAAWGVATFFVVPILALEGCRGMACVRRSSGLIKDRWGEAVGGFAIVTAWTVVVTIPGGILIGLGFAGLDASPGVAVPLIAVGLAVILAASALGGMVHQVFAVALYRYALDPADTAGQPFARQDLTAPLRSDERPSSYFSKDPDDFVRRPRDPRDHRPL